jgi:hypothetical protein
MKRYLYLTHRWLGIALCLFMAMWFFSGIVMMYVGYPKLTPAERLAGAGPLDAARVQVDFAHALAAAGAREPPQAARLVAIAGEPTFVFTFGKADFVALRASDGARVGRVTSEAAVAAARAFLGVEGVYDGEIEEDAWTHSKALDGHRPLHKVRMSDANATLLYVSSVTGEVVRDATRNERVWNWVGAWIHWLYPFRGGALDKYWHDIVVYASLAGTILALTGFTVGVMRWRFGAPYKTGSHSPYREGYMWWHHIVGLVFGVTAVAFVFSGMMSMNPWKIFESPDSTFDVKAYAGGDLAPERFALGAREALEVFRLAGFDAREIDWRLVDGRGYYVAHNESGLTQILAAEAGAEPSAMLPIERLERAGARLVKAPVKAKTVMTAYDAYYFARAPHTMHGDADKRLPVLRLEFDDANATWTHIDPYTGAVLGKLDFRRRVNRWLFAFLHSWDWPALLDARPVWDVFMIALNGGGFALSVTGIVIGWRRLRRKSEQLTARPAMAHAEYSARWK